MKAACINAALCVACFLYMPIRGTAHRAPRAPKRVVIVQMAKLGDMVCTTPLFRALKAAYPAVHLTVIGNTLNRDLLEGNQDIDTYLAFRGIKETVRELRKGTYDFGCVVTPDLTALAVLYMAGVHSIAVPKVVNGYSPYETFSYKLARLLMTQVPHRMGSYAPREYLRLLEPLGITAEDTTKHLAFAEEDAHTAGRTLEDLSIGEGQLIIGMSPSSGNKIKHWPSERFAAVADHLIETYGAKILLIGTTRDAEEIAAMMHAVKNRLAVHNAQGMFPIGALKALMKHLALFVAVDTGPIYIAEAFGTPTVDIVGPMDEWEQPPQGEKNLVVTPPLPRTPQLHILNTRTYDTQEARRQSDAISVRMVCIACDTLLQRTTLKDASD